MPVASNSATACASRVRWRVHQELVPQKHYCAAAVNFKTCEENLARSRRQNDAKELALQRRQVIGEGEDGFCGQQLDVQRIPFLWLQGGARFEAVSPSHLCGPGKCQTTVSEQARRGQGRGRKDDDTNDIGGDSLIGMIVR